MISENIFSVFFLLISPAFARIGFKKDQRIDQIEFPPQLGKTPQGVPPGHLRPLGWQRRPDGRVLESLSVPDPEEFYEKFVTTKKPIVLRQAVTDVPAMKLWANDDYLKKEYGHLDIHVIVKKELLEKGPKKMKFKKFLKEYQYEDWYLTNAIPEQMMHDLVLPRCLSCGLRRNLVESEIWMSSGGTTSLLHSHADHNLHCVLAGRKDFIMIDPKFRGKLSYTDSEVNPGAGFSDIDVDRVNMFKYKTVPHAPWMWSTLFAGDCMFVPAGHLHQVRSYGRSFSSTMQWAPTPSVDFADCKNTDLDTVIPLNDAVFMWTYTKGDMQLSNSYLSPKMLKHYLLLLMRTEDTLRYELFREMYREVMSETTDSPAPKEMWTVLAPGGSRELTREEVQTLEDSKLEQVAELFNKAHEHADYKSHDEL